MTRDDIRQTIADLLSEVLDRDDVTLADATTAPEIEGWDSLANLKLLVAAESRFGVKFTLSEMSQAADAGELVDIIRGKMG